MNKYNLYNNIIGWLTFIVSIITYTLTLEPSVSFWDCGEFISASYRLQICHPPGAPLFLMIGRIFSMFAGSDTSQVAFWVNMVSGTTSALCVLFFFWTITHLAKKIVVKKGEEATSTQCFSIFAAGLVGALTLNFSDTFWFSAVEAEVYASSSFFTTLTFWCILKWENISNEKGSDRWLILIAYLIGLAIGVHLLNLLVIPAIVYVYYFKKFDYSRMGFLKATGVAVLAIGSVQFGIIPGLPTLATKLDYIAVNMLGLSFNFGFIILVFLLITLISALIHYTHSLSKTSLAIAVITYLLMVVSSLVINSGLSSIVAWLVVSGVLYYVLFVSSLSKSIINTIILLFAFIVIGYSSYSMVVIRSMANPPLDMNDPEQPFSLLSYLNREQYGDNPLVYGQYYYSRPVDYEKTGMNYRKQGKEYVEAGDKLKAIYPSKDCVIFPRMWADRADYVEWYQRWENIPKDAKRISFMKNVDFFASYQMRFMYIRYFMWNFVGRQNDQQGYGDEVSGNWITGISFIDNLLVGPQKNIPDSIKNNKARNTYFAIPLILGLIGFFYHFRKAKADAIVVLTLFLFTGAFIILYLNFPAQQPRERDYAYVGSYQTFMIWIGLGVLAITDFMGKRMNRKTASVLVGVACLGSPILMAQQNWDDHDRSNRKTAVDFAEDYLNSCAPDAILFTNGDNDTYPLWYAQNVEDIRSDIRVINLSLLNTDWYADGLKRPSFRSKPIQFSMTSDKYVQGSRDYVVYYDGPEILDKFGINKTDYYDISKIITFMCDDNDPYSKVTLQGGQKASFFPTKRFCIPVDKKACLKNGVVRPEDAIYMQDSIKWEIEARMLQKADLVVLDVLASNINTRPIYWAITTGTEAYINMQSYFQLEGLTYRLLPILTPINPNNPVYGRVNSTILYENLVNKFKWGNIEKPGVYLDETVLRQTKNMRNIFFRLAEKLSQEGKTDSAIKAIDHCVKMMPAEYVQHDFFSVRLAEGYFMAGAKEKGSNVLREIVKQCEGKAAYYRTFKGKKQKGVQQELDENIQIIQYCLFVANQNKMEDLKKEFEAVYTKLNPGT